MLTPAIEKATVMNYFNYASPPWETSVIKGVPMALYDTKALRKEFGSFYVKFRGPRPAHPGRSRSTRQAGCLKRDAVTFTVYKKNNWFWLQKYNTPTS